MQVDPWKLSGDRREAVTYFVLACAITWILNLPWVMACLEQRAAPAYALPMMGLGAFGPTLAAWWAARRSGSLRETFGRWRTSARWVVLALLVSPVLLHLPATLIEVALGGQPAAWFYPPREPERIAGLVFFSLGEEFGWRGFAYPRLVRTFGPIRGNFVLGTMWALWHLGMMFTLEGGAPTAQAVLLMIASLALSSVVWAWFFERGNRSMAVAIALHAGAHLDNQSRMPEGELRLRVLRFAVLALAAAIAAYALTRERARANSEMPPVR